MHEDSALPKEISLKIIEPLDVHALKRLRLVPGQFSVLATAVLLQRVAVSLNISMNVWPVHFSANFAASLRTLDLGFDASSHSGECFPRVLTAAHRSDIVGCLVDVLNILGICPQL